nr:immunoglobulin heavy chain junction region [Mus musculus]MBK4184053.1 immunoglobulin heavy chain junction region [Mus musculus]MBK4184054.1 immunoglobulin heavy chain junction region [Mus musculus]MBK4184055.1 immunoglobulin heavy chain junction region [Mus musculus]MBK4184056.1 immunoglobulin heavy chain junction region [Mus musculus]
CARREDYYGSGRYYFDYW